MKYVFLIFIVFISCGKAVIDIETDDIYTPKIVVEAYIFPEKTISKVKITRNFPRTYTAAGTLDKPSFVLGDANVSIKNLNTLESVILTYSSIDNLYKDSSQTFIIDYNTSYELNVKANIDGNVLETSSITITPEKGFKLLNDHSGKQFKFLSDDQLSISFKASPSSNFYLFETIAIQPSDINFIYPPFNPYHEDPEKFKNPRVVNDYIRAGSLYTQLSYLSSYNTSTDHSKEILWNQFFFYDNYNITVYAFDQNYKDYYLSFDDVADGSNYREPVFHFTGNGLGVFASAIKESFQIEIVK